MVTGAHGYAARIQNGRHIVGMHIVDVEADDAVAAIGHRLAVNGQPGHGTHAGQHTVQQHMLVGFHMEAHEHMLLDRMLSGMRAMPWLTVYGEPVADGRYGVVSFNVNDVHPHDVATILDAGGVAVRAGHHCAQPLMEYLGIGSCCRASVAIYNTAEDVDALLENLENVRKVMGL